MISLPECREPYRKAVAKLSLESGESPESIHEQWCAYCRGLTHWPTWEEFLRRRLAPIG
jgi:hypothetical protein